jgi:phosphinothricin acetyltransferase
MAAIYNHYIEKTIVTFEKEPISSLEMLKRMDKVMVDHPWIVVESEDQVFGYAYTSWWNKRAAYNKSIEISIYLNHKSVGHGLGKLMYSHLIQDAKNKGYHSIIGGISLPNRASVKLHESFGFKKAALYKEVGYKFDKWIDVGYWQLLLDAK